MNNSTPDIWVHDIRTHRDMQKLSVCLELHPANGSVMINPKLNLEKHEREDDPSYTMPKIKFELIHAQSSTSKISHLFRILIKQ